MRPHDRRGHDDRKAGLQRRIPRVDVDCGGRTRRLNRVVERVAVRPEVGHHVLDTVAPVEAQVADQVEQAEMDEGDAKCWQLPGHASTEVGEKKGRKGAVGEARGP